MNNALQTAESQSVVPSDVSTGALEAAIGLGDFSRLTPQDRLRYVAVVCQSVGLNPLTKPFDYITLNGKLTLYANKGCAEQLRKLHGISCSVLSRVHEAGVYSVHIRARDRDGREDESLGCVPLPDGAKGDALANAMMKAETKAKRRVTLSMCGLGVIDESELETTTAKRRIENTVNTETVMDRTRMLNAPAPAPEISTQPVQPMPDAPAPTIEVPPSPETETTAELPPADSDQQSELEKAIGPFAVEALAWCVKQGWLKKSQGFDALAPARVQRILGNVNGFLRAIGAKVEP